MRSRIRFQLLLMSCFPCLFLGVCNAEDRVEGKSSVNKERIAELTKKIESNPKDQAAYRMRAFEYAQGDVWDKAAADYMQFAKLHGGNSQIGQQIGVLLVLADEKKIHATLCKEMLEGFKDSTDNGDLERTAKICALMSKPVGDLEVLLKMSKRSVERNKNLDFACHHYRTLALILYRMKKYDEAMKAVQSADQADANARFQIPNVTVCNRAIEAMCLIRGDKLEEAKKVLAKATPTLKQQFKDQPQLYQDEFWHDWLVAKVLYDEAHKLLADTKK